jgi:hypothetical protein
MTMDKIRITRTGKAALVFDGELVASSDGKLAAGREQNRWHDLKLYKTAGGNFVGVVDYVTQWQGEIGYTCSEQVKADGVQAFFRSYDPDRHVQGFPNAPQYAERQETLLRWIRDRYEVQVSELLSSIKELDEVVE